MNYNTSASLAKTGIMIFLFSTLFQLILLADSIWGLNVIIKHDNYSQIYTYSGYFTQLLSIIAWGFMGSYFYLLHLEGKIIVAKTNIRLFAFLALFGIAIFFVVLLIDTIYFVLSNNGINERSQMFFVKIWYSGISQILTFFGWLLLLPFFIEQSSKNDKVNYTIIHKKSPLYAFAGVTIIFISIIISSIFSLSGQNVISDGTYTNNLFFVWRCICPVLIMIAWFFIGIFFEKIWSMKSQHN